MLQARLATECFAAAWRLGCRGARRGPSCPMGNRRRGGQALVALLHGVVGCASLPHETGQLACEARWIGACPPPWPARSPPPPKCGWTLLKSRREAAWRCHGRDLGSHTPAHPVAAPAVTQGGSHGGVHPAGDPPQAAAPIVFALTLLLLKKLEHGDVRTEQDLQQEQ